MTSVIFIKDATHRLDPSDEIGQGGEAVVYRYGRSEAVKVYMKPDDPAFAGNPNGQIGARRRLEEHQRKLAAFPKNLTDRVVAPRALAYDSDEPKSRRVVGYTMEYLQGLEVLMMYANKKYRKAGGIDANQAVEIFRDLYRTVVSVHRAGVVIGDFNDLNVLVNTRNQTYLVDADSMQFGPFLCRTFTNRFVDPLICSPTKLVMAKPHNQSSDWYAFSTMLFQTLLFINPYGGVHDPADGGQQLGETARIMQRMTVFADKVIYPKAAVPYKALPDDLLEYFTELYTKDKRGVPPEKLLDALRWTTCTVCGLMHARQICPVCVGTGAVKQRVVVRGNVTATSLFRTTGQILQAAYQGNALRYVYHESGAYKREDQATILTGGLDPELRIRTLGAKTVFAKSTSLMVLGPGGQREAYETQMIGRLPVFATNGNHLYRLDGGHLVRDAVLGQQTIGSILPNRTLLWVGERFGFGFFRAGAITRGLVFDAERTGINDSVPLPSMAGNMIDATCSFASHLAWFMVSIEQEGKIYNYCYVISDKGELLAQAQAPQGDGSWLGENIRGRMAQGNQLFAATDTGIVRIEINGGQLDIGREYPDTEPFVNATTQLLPSAEGIIAVSSNEIVRLQIR